MNFENGRVYNQSPLDKGKLQLVYYHTDAHPGQGRTSQGRSVYVQGYKNWQGKFMKWIGKAEYLGEVTVSGDSGKKERKEKIYVNKRSLGKQILIQEEMDPKEANDKKAKDKAVAILFPNHSKSESVRNQEEFRVKISGRKIQDLGSPHVHVYVPSKLESYIKDELILENVYKHNPNPIIKSTTKRQLIQMRFQHFSAFIKEQSEVIQEKIKELNKNIKDLDPELKQKLKIQNIPDFNDYDVNQFYTNGEEEIEWFNNLEKKIEEVNSNINNLKDNSTELAISTLNENMQSLNNLMERSV